MKRLSLIFLTLFCIHLLYAQQSKNANTLLWRITGKGLSRPSYLYGTIHLTDKKVFFLGDSVYQAIDNTDGFASELDLNSLGMEMINQLMKEEEEKKSTEPVKVKDAVSQDIWGRYKDALSQKFGKKAELITVDDLEEKDAELENEVLRKGDMQTFLDAHLFGLAKKKGKWVGGIEDIADQFEHIDSKTVEQKLQSALYDEDYYRHGLDWLKNMYINQQLDSIDAAMYREQSGEKDYIMIKRNVKMARRMDSLSAIRSTFFAVGAAHLPGDSGIISMLRARGFQVEPVISSKKIDPSKYVLENNDEAWFPVEIKDSAYFLSMPGLASKFEMLEELGLDTKLFFDISFMKMYMTMSVELGETRKALGADSLFKGIKKQYAEKSTDMKEKKIIMNGEEGHELSYNTKQGSFTMQIFFPKMDRVVINAIMAFKEQALADDDSKKFFQSFAVNKNIRKKTNDEIVWTSYVNPIQAFSIDFPSKPIEKKDVRSEEGKIVHSFQSVDIKSQVFYGARISSVKEGLYLSITDSAHLRALIGDIRMRFEDAHIIDSSIILIDGFPACKISATGKTQGSDIVLNILSVLRGNKNYYLFALYQPSGKAKENADRYLTSFKILPYDYPKWETQSSKERTYSTTAPFPLRPYHWSENERNNMNIERVMLYDTMASHSLFIDRIIIPSWYWHNSDTAFIRFWANKHVQYGDSIADYKISKNGKTKMVEFFVVKPGETTIKKVKLVLLGNEIYDLYGTLAKADLERSYNRFFDDFKILKEPAALDLPKTKFNELAEAIKKGNKENIEEIKVWWSSLEFSEPDITGLQSLMLQVYPDYDSIYQNSLNWKIIEQIRTIDTSNHTIDFIQANFKKFGSLNNKVKPLLLSYLSSITTKDSYKLIKQVLADEEYPADMKMYYDLSFYDSLELTATLYPEILKLAKNEYLADEIYRTTITLFDSNLLTKKMLLDHEKQFIDQAAVTLKEKTKDDEVYNYCELVMILGILNTPASNKILTQFSKYSDRQMKFTTVVAMLKNNLTVDQRNIYTLATTDEFRYKLYEELRKLKKLSLFPANYLSQEQIGASKLHTQYQDDEYNLGIMNVGSRTITYKGKQQKVYLYRVADLNDDDYSDPGKMMEYYLAVAGPFPLNSKDCYSAHELTGIFWDEGFDGNKIDKLLKKYIESFKEKEK